jgi:hypothetical protein
MYMTLTPAPTENISFTFHAMEGLMLTVSTSDLIAWKRPTQPESYSVVRPNGAPTPIPAQTSGVSCHDRYPPGTNSQPPASPPLSVSPVVISGGSVVRLLSLLNLISG